jgi:hypothetical protein
MTDSPQGLVERLRALADYFSPPSGAGTDHAISCPCAKCIWADDLREAAHALREAQKDAVPREPTEAMLIAGYDALSNVQNEDETAEEMMRRAYFAMLDAARKVGTHD